MKPVLHPGGNEDHTTHTYLSVLVGNSYMSASFHYVVHFVLSVRPLWIVRPCGELVHTETHSRRVEELDVQLPRLFTSGEQVRHFEYVHIYSSYLPVLYQFIVMPSHMCGR